MIIQAEPHTVKHYAAQSAGSAIATRESLRKSRRKCLRGRRQRARLPFPASRAVCFRRRERKRTTDCRRGIPRDGKVRLSAFGSYAAAVPPAARRAGSRERGRARRTSSPAPQARVLRERTILPRSSDTSIEYASAARTERRRRAANEKRPRERTFAFRQKNRNTTAPQ